MRTKEIIASIAIALVMNGCATNVDMSESVDKQKDIIAKSTACYEGRAKIPAIKPLIGKVYFGGSAQTPFSYFTQEERPTEQEKPAIAAFAEASGKCDEIMQSMRHLPQYPESYMAVLNKYFSNRNSLLLDLYQGKLSYGDFAKRVDALKGDRISESADAERVVRRDAEESRAMAAQSAAQSSQARSSSIIAGAAIANAMKPPVVIQQPVTTNRMTNCTTSPNGFGGLNTTCY